MKLIYEDPVATCIDSIIATITYDITDDWGRTRYDQEMQFTGSQTELRKRLKDLRIMGATNIEVDTEPCFYENMNEDTDYDRQLLGRLISDCKYFLGNGNGSEKHLWAGSVKDQIAKMRELYNSLSKGKKSVGITLADIDAFEEEMLDKLNSKKESYKRNRKRAIRESNKIDIMDLLTSERVDLMIDLWNDPKVTGGISTDKAMKYWEAKGYDCSKYTPEEFNRVWDLAQDELDAHGYVDDEEEYEEEIETKEDAYYWLQSKLAEYGNTYHFPQEERIKLDRLIDKFGNTYFWRR